MTSSNAKAVSGPTPACILSRRAMGRFSTTSSSVPVISWIFGVSWSSRVSRNAIKHGFFSKYLLTQHRDGKKSQDEYDDF